MLYIWAIEHLDNIFSACCPINEFGFIVMFYSNLPGKNSASMVVLTGVLFSSIIMVIKSEG